MKLRPLQIFSLVLVLLSFAVAWYVYPLLPEKIASHWDAAGNVNGYMSRFWGAFLLPIMVSVLFVFYLVVPRLDPKRHNIEKFQLYFDRFVVLVLLFMFYIYGLTLAWNMGYTFDMVRYLIPAFVVVFYYAGTLISHAEPNWFIGIRTPWTLSNVEVWRKTHALGGKLFRGAALVGIFGLFFPTFGIWFVLVPLLLAALVSTVYSFIEYRKVAKVT